MIHINYKEVNKVAEFNLLNDIINTPKHTKKLNRHYSPILHERMNTRYGKARLKNFQIILESGCSSKIVMGILVEKLHPEKCCDAVSYTVRKYNY